MLLEAYPLLFGELHSFPVIVAEVVFIAEFNAPGLLPGALRSGDVGLELDHIGAGVSDGVDIGVRRSQASVMGLCDLSYDQDIVVFVFIPIHELPPA